MKKFFALICSLIFVQIGFAQEVISVSPKQLPNLPESLIEKISDDSCECMTGNSLNDMNQSQIEMQMGVCILQSVGKFKTEIESYLGQQSIIDIMTEQFGEQVGIKMALVCPQIFMFFSNYSEGSMEMAYAVELGKIKSIEKKQFNMVNLEMYDGSVLKFLWLWEFDGSEILTKNQYKNKWVNIFYSTLEFYDPDLKKYVPYKVIEAIELGE
jgi:hypothetical protein